MDSPSSVAKNVVWRSAYARWPRASELREGYTALLPVPGDMPVFLTMAAAVAAHQDPTHCLGAIVVPDQVNPAFLATFQNVKRSFDWCPLSLETISRRGRALQRGRARVPGTNHFLQVYHGVAAARSSHVLLHDADLFVLDPGFLRSHYELCHDTGAAAVGVNRAWDDWLRGHGGDHVVATWELMADTRWLRSFSPAEHRPHTVDWHGEPHEFDLTLKTQLQSPPHDFAVNARDEDLLHFNYVFSFYRSFQAERGDPFEDDRFVLLLLRLLGDAFGAGPGEIELPLAPDLARGIGDPTQPVTYCAPAAAEDFGEFRDKVGRLVQAPFITDAQASSILRGLEPFDAAFG